MAGITAAVIGGVAAVGSAVISSKGIKGAAKTQKRAAQRAIDEQIRQVDLTRADFAGILERGELAGEEEAAFLGLLGPEAEQEALSRFGESPGQAFLRERQERALLRNEAAIGGLGGGNVRTALQEQAFGIACTALGERKDRLSQVAARGAGATGTVAQLGQQTATNVGNIGIVSGAQQAANTLALTSARQSGLRNIAGAFTGSGGIFNRNRPPPPTTNPGFPF